MKINKKYIIIGILIILTLILAICFAVNVNATDTTVVDDEKTIVRMVAALVKGSDSIATTNLQNGLNKYVGSGVATAGTEIGNVIPVTFTETGNIYEVNVNTGATFDDSSGVQEYTITYNANGGTGAPGAQTKIENVELILSTTQPTREGYTFLGWSTSSSATSAEYTAGAQFTTDANTTLYAVWESKTYTLTLNPNGGLIDGSSTTRTSNWKYGAKTIPDYMYTRITREGYTFLGWSTNSTATEPLYQSGETITITSNLTLYAVWKVTT